MVAKVGGSVLEALPPPWWDDAAAVARGRGLVLVHGWSAPLRAAQLAAGRQPLVLTSQHGRRSRFTDAEVLGDIRRTSAGLTALAAREMSARGATVAMVDAAAARILTAEVRPQRWWVDGELRRLENLVGPVRAVDAVALARWRRAVDALVVTPLAVAPGHPAVNTDADRAAAWIATALGAPELVFVTDVPGVLIDGAVRRRLRAGEADAAAEASGGMRKKLDAATAALGRGLTRAVIGRAPIGELLAGRAGTEVVA
ncbi:hypothetical protein GCM10010170_022690 [Dactylosporangium salmoneum]|uniref:Aspartate/glutamate/uridylate kinase domain-containing protein n=1 Tax=Dactylosporangium salmoneum TaxID=53361 RepID=A0ABP5SW46_9ACTN